MEYKFAGSKFERREAGARRVEYREVRAAAPGKTSTGARLRVLHEVYPAIPLYLNICL